MLREVRIAKAFAIYADRRNRDAVFGDATDGFGEPAWDMMLMLYVHDASDQPVTMQQLLGASSAPAQVAARYLDWMASRGLATTARGEADCIRLEEAGRSMMEAYLDRNTGLA